MTTASVLARGPLLHELQKTLLRGIQANYTKNKENNFYSAVYFFSLFLANTFAAGEGKKGRRENEEAKR